MIFQQFNLLETKTVYENIALPLVLNHVPKDQIKKKVQEVLEYVELTDKKDVYPSKLSGGQKQRLCIARAMIKKPKIVIFDDCLSAVDARTEKEILNNLYNFLANKTAIIITHRIFSLISFDIIIVMDNGKILEKGTHDELITLNGHYAEMYRKQQEQDQDEV